MEKWGQKLCCGFPSAEFETDGFAMDPYEGVRNYERLDTMYTEIPVLSWGADPYVDLVNFIDTIDKPGNKFQGLFKDDVTLQSEPEEDDDAGESNPYILPELPELPEFDLPDYTDDGGDDGDDEYDF